MSKMKSTANGTQAIRKNTVIHNIDPVFDSESKILILGSFPSVKSREAEFFYAHPRNRFWSVLAAVTDCEKPETVEEKKAFLINNHIALWDVVGQCEISASADTSIKNVIPNDISAILKKADIRSIIVNGKTAEKYYNKYLLAKTGIKAVCLPSTSPANAAKKFDDLISEWSIVKDLFNNYMLRTALVEKYLGKTVQIKIDRPIGYVHKKEKYTLVYPINYGYIPGVFGGDGEELDVYLLGVSEPVTEYTCKIIGAVIRKNDVEDKLIAAPDGINFTADEAYEMIKFQEQWYDTEIRMEK